jgi:sterol desaturase/sphingolipid hydroxylase (fatty acid hydroxylase superfamily)
MQYWHWLLLLTVLFFALERVLPERRTQRLLRPGFLTDLLFLALNGHFFGLLLAWLQIDFLRFATTLLNPALGVDGGAARFLAHVHPVLQFLAALVVLDFVKWCVHNLLHRVPFLWSFHKVHHGITTLDWIGNWRFHWAEVLVYQSLTAIPLYLLITAGVPPGVLLAYYVLETAIGNLNHANLRVDLGPLRYVLNSPRMHIWHHDRLEPGQPTKNFGIVLSVWDWIFGTARMPERPPEDLGFAGMERMPRGFLGLVAWPLGPRGALPAAAPPGLVHPPPALPDRR